MASKEVIIKATDQLISSLEECTESSGSSVIKDTAAKVGKK